MRNRLILSVGVMTLAATFALLAISLTSATPASDRPTQPDRPNQPTLASLTDEPEAQLQAPGSTEFLTGGTDAVWTTEAGSTPAIAWRRYGVHSSWGDIVSYFAAEMSTRGWRVGGCSGGLQSTGEWAVEAWHSDNRILRLGHRRDLPPDAGAIGTYYSVALIGEGVPPGCADSDERASAAASESAKSRPSEAGRR